MEQHERNRYSPAGEVHLWGELAWGLKHNRLGRRRAVRMLIALAVLILIGLGLLYLLALSGLLT